MAGTWLWFARLSAPWPSFPDCVEVAVSSLDVNVQRPIGLKHRTVPSGFLSYHSKLAFFKKNSND